MTTKFDERSKLLMDTFLKAAKHLKADSPIDAAFGACGKAYGLPGIMVGLIEKRFMRIGRPFFNVYPSVLTALAKTRLEIRPDSIPKSVIHDLQTISVKIPTGCEIQSYLKMSSFIVSIVNEEQVENLRRQGCGRMFNTDGKPFIVVCGVETDNNNGISGVGLSSCPLDGTFEDAVFAKGVQEDQYDRCHLMCRIALGVMLLASDPDYVKPVLLRADEGKTTPIEERIARAKNRGVYGFTIGEEIERSPHFRRPHFAIRWTGKGGEIPKLVPVKGAIVGKEKMTTVPTGFEEQYWS